MSTHCAVATTSKNAFDEIKVATEKPGPGEVLLKHAYGSMILTDTYQVDLALFVDTYPLVLGFGAAGVVEDVGSDVRDLKVGDRVTVLAYRSSRSRALQEYSIQPWNLCAKIPDSLPLDQAATIPDNFVTAFYTIFHSLSLPIPEFPVTTPPPLSTVPILVYGAGSIAGQYMIQVLHAAGYKNIIATASPKHHDYIRSLGASSVFDYRSPTLVDDIAKVAGVDAKVRFAIDPIASQETIATIAKVISPLGTVALLLPIKAEFSVSSDAQLHTKLPEEWNVLPKGTKYVEVMAMNYEQDIFLKENLLPKILPQLLQLELVKPSRILRLEEGTLKDRVGKGLDLLRGNKVSGEKVIVKINDA